MTNSVDIEGAYAGKKLRKALEPSPPRHPPPLAEVAENPSAKETKQVALAVPRSTTPETQDQVANKPLDQKNDAPLILKLPEEPPGTEPLQYVLEGYTRSTLLGGAPWQPQSREADFGKTLQLQLPHQIIEAASLHVMTRRRAGTSFAEEGDAKIECEWKLATRIHRLATHEPKWEGLLAKEYLRLQRNYTNQQIQQLCRRMV